MPLPSTRLGLNPDSTQVILVMMSTGLVATRNIPLKPDEVTGSMMERNTCALRFNRSRRVSPGFWATPAQITTMSASAQSLYSPA